MIFMGNGERSAAKCWNLVADLTGLLIDLGGLQQPLHLYDEKQARTMTDIIERDRNHWEERAESFLQAAAEALGYKITLTQIKE